MAAPVVAALGRAALGAAMGAIEGAGGKSQGEQKKTLRNIILWGVSITVVLVVIFIYATLGALSSLGVGADVLQCIEGQEEVQIADDADLSTVSADSEMCVTLASTTGAWGGYENGKIPLSALQQLSWAPGHYLRADAAAAAEEMNLAYNVRFGVNMTVSDSYRDYEGQVAVKQAKPHLAATPGTSNHGWALAVDWGGGIEQFGSEQHQWMVDNAAIYGWTHPAWAQQGGSKPEAWHWEYTRAQVVTDTTGTTPDSARQIGQEMIGSYGWGDSEFTCLNALWTRESNWRWNADNPSSSAYGIPQALPGSKMASMGADWETNPRTQIAWGLSYIASRYGSPCSAWAHSEAKGWY